MTRTQIIEQAYRLVWDYLEHLAPERLPDGINKDIIRLACTLLGTDAAFQEWAFIQLMSEERGNS